MDPIASTTINGRAYRLVRLPPLQSGRLAMRVAQALAPALADADLLAPLVAAFRDHQGAPGEAKEKLASMIGDAPRLLAAMAGGVQKVNADALYSAAVECVTGNLFAGEKLADETATNRYFSEYPADLLPVLVWALRENCAGFFGKGAPALK